MTCLAGLVFVLIICWADRVKHHHHHHHYYYYYYNYCILNVVKCSMTSASQIAILQIVPY